MMSTAAIREPAVAGTFYPGDPEVLRELVHTCLEQGRRHVQGIGAVAPKALIAPHAGYVYSGPIAGSAYATLEPLRDRIERVVLLGPSHRVAFRGLALSSAAIWRTPLGDVPLDRAGAAALEKLPQVRVFDAAHAAEHSLEVQLPFLQETLGCFELLPLVAGDATPQDVAQVLELAWGGPETLIVVSSDLSHYHDHAMACSIDRVTTAAIEALRPEGLGEASACGRVPVRGLLVAARLHTLTARTLDVRNSGDTAGPRDRVVGYGAYAFSDGEPGREEPSSPPGNAKATHAFSDGGLGREERVALLRVAHASIEHVLRTGGALDVDVAAYPPALRELRATFVTVRGASGELRGCIGELEPHRALVASVADRARAAAFSDPRFPPLRAHEVGALAIHVSVLLPLTPIDAQSEEELVVQLRPGVDGLVIDDGVHRATFLPAVWESLPEPSAFLRALRHKAGMSEQIWPATLRAWRYAVDEIGPSALSRG